MTQFERTNDMELVKQIFTDPKVYRNVGDDFCPEWDEFTPVDHPALWYVLAKDGTEILGLFLFNPQNVVCWEIHVAMLPSAWGARAQQALRDVIQWVFETTPCQRIAASIPEHNRLALHYAERAGFETFGVNQRSFMKNGRLLDQVMLGISKTEVQ